MSVPFAAGVRLPTDVLLQEMVGESVLLNLASERYFGLDDIGTSMFKSLTTASTIEHAYENLLADFDVEPVQLRSDLQQLIEQLMAQGLLEIRPE